MKPRLHIESTIPSYLAARPSRNLVTAAHQQATQKWREKRRNKYMLFVSEIVVEECGRGDAEVAQRRLDLID